MSEPNRFPSPRRSNRGPQVAGCLLALLSIASISPALAQFKLQQAFTGTSAPGWTISGDALLTAPSVDPVGAGMAAP